MANEITAATETYHFATTLMGRDRDGDPNDGAANLKEQTGVALAEGYFLTSSRFIAPSNGGAATTPGIVEAFRGHQILDPAPARALGQTIFDFSEGLDEGAGDLVSEITLVRAEGATGAPLIGMVFYADPAEASGSFQVTGYTRADRAAAAREYTLTLTAGDFAEATLKNRDAADQFWFMDNGGTDLELIGGGEGVYQQLDINQPGAWYVAGLGVSPNAIGAGEPLMVDPISTVYFQIAAALEADGAAADDIGRNALIAASAGGSLNGTFLNEDMLGSDAADTLNGLAGDDYLAGAGGDDLLIGGEGEDSLEGGEGDATLLGGAGEDRAIFDGDAADFALIASFGTGAVIEETATGDQTTVLDVERLVFDDVEGLTSDAASFVGGPSGAAPAPEEAPPAEEAAPPAETTGGEAGEAMTGGGADDQILGMGGEDTLRGRGGDDLLDGGAGADRLVGGRGGDTLEGGGGADVLRGGRGQDLLIGGAGADTLTGGRGADTFQFGPSDGRDVIRDFGRGADQIQILDGAETFDDLTLVAERGGVTVSFAETEVFLRQTDLADLSADDFLFG